MNLPSKVKLGGRTFDVLLVSDLKSDDDKELRGQISFYQNTIKLDKNQKEDMRSSTLLHEILHGILVDRDVKHSESLIVHLESGLIQVFRDNPKILKYLQQNI